MPDFEEITRRVMKDGRLIPVQMAVSVGWRTHAMLDLAQKHPVIHTGLRREYRDLAHGLSRAILTLYPESLNALLHPVGMRLEDFIREASPAMMSDQVLLIPWSVRQIWLLVSAVQMVVRHSEMEADTRAALVDFAHQLEPVLLAHHPDVAELLAAGWKASE